MALVKCPLEIGKFPDGSYRHCLERCDEVESPENSPSLVEGAVVRYWKCPRHEFTFHTVVSASGTRMKIYVDPETEEQRLVLAGDGGTGGEHF